MHQKRILTFMLFFFVFSSCKKKESSAASPMVDFKNHYRISSQFVEQTSTVMVTVTMDKLLHAYAEGEKIGRPVRLAIIEENGWAKASEPVLPPGIKKTLPGLGESVILEDSFSIEQKVKKGQGPLLVMLYLQVCTDNACDQPREHKLTIYRSH